MFICIGLALITKAEFDALKNNFQSQIDNYNTSLDSKIDGAIASYLAGISMETSEDVKFLVSNSEAVKFVDNFRFRRWKAKRAGNAATGINAGWNAIENGVYVTDYYGTESSYPWGQELYYDWTHGKDLREGKGVKWDFMKDSCMVFWNQTVSMVENCNLSWGPSATDKSYAHVFVVNLEPKDNPWDDQDNKIYKNLVSLGKKDGALFYPTKVYPAVACRIFTGSLLFDVRPVYHSNANFGISWKGYATGYDSKIAPDTSDTTSALALKNYHRYDATTYRDWFYKWSGDNYKLYPNVTNIDNHTDKSKDCTYEYGGGNEDLSNVMCITNKTLYVSCVGGSTPFLTRTYAGFPTVQLYDGWWDHSNQPYGETDWEFGSTVADQKTYTITNAVVGGPTYDPTQWNANLSWDSTTEVKMGCPSPLVNSKIKDLGSTVLRDNDGLTVKIGDGLPVCSIQKKGNLKLIFKVTSSDNQKVKVSFKYKGFQEAGDYLKDKTGVEWKDKEVTSGITNTVEFPIEKLDEIIYCGIINNDNTGVRSSKISLLSGTITYDK